MNFAKTLIISALVSFGIGLAMLNLPAQWFSLDHWFGSQKLGTAFTTLTTTDQLSNFPTTYNANVALTANTSATNSFTALNQFLNATSTKLSALQVWFGATATSTFGTDGALTLITPLLPASGGTGSTTLSSNQVLLGNGTGNIKTVTGWGTTNQILTSQGAGNAPTWTTTLSLAADNLWTGSNIFSGGATTTRLVASSTSANPLILNTVSYDTPSTQGASSTVLTNDGAGHLKWLQTDRVQLYATTTTSAVQTITATLTASSTDFTIYFYSAGLSSTNSIDLTFNGESTAHPNFHSNISLNYGTPTDVSTRIFADGYTATSSPLYNIIKVHNPFTQNKTLYMEGAQYASNGYSDHFRGSGFWKNSTSTITTITFDPESTETFNIGSSVIIEGTRN